MNYSLLKVPSTGFIEKNSNSSDKKSMLNENLPNTIDKIFLLLASGSFPIYIQLLHFPVRTCERQVSPQSSHVWKLFPHRITVREFTMTIALDYARATTEVRISVWLLSVQFCSSPAHPHSLSANTKTHVWFYPCGYSQKSQGTHIPNHTPNPHFTLVRPLDIT